MKLLFDQNLSPKLAHMLSDLFPGSQHVHALGLGEADDDRVWDYARDDGFVIVTKDGDYNHLSVMRGTPPKVIWLQLGNCTTAAIDSVMRVRLAEVLAFEADASVGTMVLSWPTGGGG
jgi:predicted nuclease of predicted toxin-antitoxin system